MIISVSGLIGSGKDTIAQRLVDAHGYTRMSFSAALKDAVSAIFGWDRAMLEGITAEHRATREARCDWWSEKLDLEVSPRSMLQDFGTRIMREGLNQSIWVYAVENRLSGKEKVVFSDARFFEELNMIHQLGGKTIGVYRNTPKWLDTFYTKVDEETRRHLGIGFQEIDLKDLEAVSIVREAAKRSIVLCTDGVTVHHSEWEHLLWPKYDRIIPNTKTIKDLHDYADSLV